MADRHLRPVQSEERLLTRHELAGLLHVSERTIDRMRAEGLPEVRWGRTLVRFRPSEAMAWLEQRRAA